ncbi:MAG: glycerophosphodiester phosphodiesterase [Vicinamibacterales bacterium]|nr:glycerophosphodiester phosphodiesterase [Vicinamibacterales bacterium]
MPHVFDPGPLILAHRGGLALRPENTLAAFEHAAGLGVDGFECDLRLSRDGEVMVIHDATLDRTTDGQGPVAALTAAELSRVDAAAGFKVEEGAPFRGRGWGVPRLADLLPRFPGLRFVLELKGEDLDLAPAAVAAVRACGALDRVCFGGFDDGVIAAVRAECPEAVTSAATQEIRWAIYRAWVGLPPRAPRFQGYQVPERYGTTRVASKRFVGVMRDAGLPVQVWTVNREADMRRLFDWGVQAVITDVPDLAVPVARAWRGERTSR